MSRLLSPANCEILFTGNEAIARGSLEAGVSVAYGYPGTPSSEIITGELNYPLLPEIQHALHKTTAKSWLIDATGQAVKMGNPVLSNIIMIGALSATDLLPIDRRSFKKNRKKNDG
ncbi:MAG: hypothetical protein AB2L12_14635 [Smithellaceae bacterium]